MFASTTAAFYGTMALIVPSHCVFLVGPFAATITFRMVSSAAHGVTNTLAQRHSVSGQMSGVISMPTSLPDLISFVGGGLLSQTLGGQGAAAAARTLFPCAAGSMLAIVVLGLTVPKWVFEDTRQEPHATHVTADLKRLARHWPIYPAMAIQLLWQFAPATGTVLRYHNVDKLHATDAQWGD